MATHLLHRAAAEAAFLLPQRGSTPPTANLLGINVNRGAAIRVRLRSPTAPSTFLDYDAVLSTLLHELAHIAVGPHDVRFYTVLGELKAAVEAARIRSAGMASVGVYLPTEGRPAEAAAAAAAKARAAAAASGRGGAGVHLGGRPRRVGAARSGGTGGLFRLCLPAEMAAAAALRRAADDLTCGTGGEAGVGTAAGTAIAPVKRVARGGAAALSAAPSTAGGRGAVAVVGGKAEGGASKRPRTGTGTPATEGGRVLGRGATTATAAAGAAAAARAAGAASTGRATGRGTSAMRGTGWRVVGERSGAAAVAPPPAEWLASGGVPEAGRRTVTGVMGARPAGRSVPPAVSRAKGAEQTPRGAAQAVPPWARAGLGGPNRGGLPTANGGRPTFTVAPSGEAAGATAGAATEAATGAGPPAAIEVVVLDADDEPPTVAGGASPSARAKEQGNHSGRDGGGGGRAADLIVLDDSD
ncbi:hypothetical protein MMPV_009749 [Pyropia vietnamensis]